MDNEPLVLVTGKLNNSAVRRLQKQYGKNSVVFTEGYPNDATSEQILKALQKYPSVEFTYIRSTKVDVATAKHIVGKNIEVIRGGSGIDNLAEIIRLGAPVTSTPGKNSLSVTELGVGLIANHFIKDFSSPFSASVLGDIINKRRITESNEAFHGKVELKNPNALTNETLSDENLELNQELLKVLSNTPASKLKGKNIFLTGATGETGALMVKIAKSLGMNVYAVKGRKVTEGYAKTHGINLVDNLEEGFGLADIVSLHTPLSKETKGMITQEHFNILANSGRDALVVNCARAGLFAEGIKTDVAVAIDDKPDDVKKTCAGMKNLVATHQKSGAKTNQSEERIGYNVTDIIDERMGKGPGPYITKALKAEALKRESGLAVA